MAPGRGHRTDLNEIKDLIKEGVDERAIADQHFSKWVIYRRSFSAYRELLNPPTQREVSVCLLVGDPGVGKTRYVFERAQREGRDLWISSDPTLTWFQGYTGQEWVLLDDFRGGSSFEWLLRVLDRYPLYVPIKGSSVPWRATCVWITSNLHLEEWYHGVDLAPLSRRITRTVHITN